MKPSLIWQVYALWDSRQATQPRGRNRSYGSHETYTTYSHRHDRAPAFRSEPAFEFFGQLFSSGLAACHGKRGGTTAGHQRGHSAFGPEKFLEQGEQRIFLERGRLERVVELCAGVCQIPGMQQRNKFLRPRRLAIQRGRITSQRLIRPRCGNTEPRMN